MIRLSSCKYQSLLNNNLDLTSGTVCLIDHLGGFDIDCHNVIFDHLAKNNYKNKFLTQYYLDSRIKEIYKDLDINFSKRLHEKIIFNSLKNYNIHPDINFKNFLCSFNGSSHVSRKLLVSIIKKFGWFDPDYCSKNFQFDLSVIDGHLGDFLSPDQQQFYNKFFLTSNEFSQQKYSFGHVRFDHKNNIYTLETKLTESFLHIVSETLATSYYPYVTEKFLYSVVTRGLFLAYAQPGWHSHIEKYYGFKKYTKLFDYSFDSIENPVERLVELISMISKFSVLTPDEWKDLYLLEQDAIEYNYNHYFSGDYLKFLKLHE